MRKQTKLVAVLSAAALLALGASMTSFAAGWEKDEAGIWHYYDEDDELVTDEWKKDGGKWFYLDEDGDMLTDGWVDDDYYVGEDGAMLVNQWVKTMADEDEDDPSEDGEFWYYFGSKGKKVSEDSKKINGKTYYFDDEGKMKSGWQMIGEYAYYLGGEDEGWRAENQWLWLEKSGLIENDDEDDELTGTPVLDCDDEDGEICDDEGWYWFQSSGKLYKDAKKKKINGKYYMFNDHGQMLYEWIDNDTTVKVGSNAQLDGKIVATDSQTGKLLTPDVKNLMYYNDVEDGSRAKGWYQIDGAQDVGKDNDTNWYYFDDGDVTYADSLSDWATADEDKTPIYRTREKIKESGNKYFCFDNFGKMKTGLQYVADDGGFYYFDGDGFQKTGRLASVECDDDDYTFYFNTKNGKNGLGYTGEKDGYLYFNGKRLEADDDYRIYYLNGDLYLVNTKGKIQKAKDGKYFDIENDGIGDVVPSTDANKDGEFKVKTNGNKIESVGSKTYAELIADVASDLKAASKYADAVTDDNSSVSIPSIELYDDVFTYGVTGTAIDKAPQWLHVNGIVK